MRYMIGSRMFMLGDDISIFDRNDFAPIRKLASLHALKQVEVLRDPTDSGTATPSPAPSACRDTRAPPPPSDRLFTLPSLISFTAHSYNW